VARLLIALGGALVITVLLLFGMRQVTSVFAERDSTRYFSVDLIQAPDRGRQRPTLAPTPELPPERTRLQFDSSSAILSIDRPGVDGSAELAVPAAAPELDADKIGSP